MKDRFLLSGVLLAIVAGFGVFLGTGVAAAQDDGNGAVVQRDPYGTPLACHILDTNGDNWVFDCTIQRVIGPDGTVNEHIDGPITDGPPLPSTAIHDVTTADTGEICDVVGSLTTSIVKGTVTPSGQVHLTCRGGTSNGAVVQRDPYGSPFSCHILDTNGDNWVFDCTIQRVIGPDGTVNEYIDGPITSGPALPTTAIHDVTTADTGEICDAVGSVITSIVKGTVTPSGHVNLTCRGAP